ncbi:SLAP domain-containing protein [Clostridium frigidicarnis]|uniref:SLAP domain-containing protein n=1 Tax=Clostridium frigidicarnis TaxID=84698 RepID=A0A1I0VYZ9_9CLOT|nr:SLAP domain-containing protein [Clostridium frigidicarnis]SFA81160.1 SLAP domain-containing protein [Clostridium frigidicarnis]
MSKFKFNINLTGGRTLKEKKLKTLILQEEVRKLPEMEMDQLKMDTLYIHDMGDEIECKLMLRSTVKAPLTLSDMKFIMKDENENVITNMTINLNFLGTIDQYSATPVTLTVNKKNLNLEGIDLRKCKLVFAENIGAHTSTSLTLDHVDETIDVLHVRAIERHISAMEPMKKETWGLEQFKVVKEEDDSVSVIFLLKNAFDKGFTIDKPVVRLKDSMGITMASTTVDKLGEVKSGTVGAFKVNFKDEDIILKNTDELLYGKLDIANAVSEDK